MASHGIGAALRDPQPVLLDPLNKGTATADACCSSPCPEWVPGACGYVAVYSTVHDGNCHIFASAAGSCTGSDYSNVLRVQLLLLLSFSTVVGPITPQQALFFQPGCSHVLLKVPSNITALGMGGFNNSAACSCACCAKGWGWLIGCGWSFGK